MEETMPPFPTNVTTHPLLVIDHARIVAGDEEEVDRLWHAATTLGFWYLKNHGVEEEVRRMFEMGRETMALPMEEKMKFEQGDSGMSAGYKAAGANATDENGSPDTVEFINVAKDDALAYPRVVYRTYPRTVNARMETAVRPFVAKSSAVNTTLLRVLGRRLGLPEGALEKRHSDVETSGSEARCIRKPAMSEKAASSAVAIGGHTDFGSLSFLHNRLGGLQVLTPGTDEWQYVKPIPGHAICNLGDAMALFSGGILRSNMHRVVPPPGEQSKFERWSLVFFTRPGNSVPLRALEAESALIAEAVEKADDSEKYRGTWTSSDWFARRIKNQRLRNRTVCDDVPTPNFTSPKCKSFTAGPRDMACESRH
ncbi:Clavaminate synthase-like protein [Punctularia strigosozonata HHB-11173 SS5]|uniref:Clavaminate synthase-like protein n=1 Tax=Punctularia strigosozonata (strain HHB-11173) TaxID=741275 RepID=UPI00044166D8|nr:Clavaminate synthase-like protein [Punctularia strigosozonata HHB-11173 SS5]EIN05629.1 Clavaminate synthase-like protein [Punctularia strigosozonata HHB-11173 SS5]